jgi:hypothetical protein
MIGKLKAAFGLLIATLTANTAASLEASAALTDNSRAARQNNETMRAHSASFDALASQLALQRQQLSLIIEHAEFLATSKKNELSRSGHSK